MSHPRALLESLGAAARKSLSQNFLVSPHWAERLVKEALSVSADGIWEIGPGLGALTRLLAAKTSLPITLFEYDRKLSAHLREIFPQAELVEGDVLDQNLAERSQGKRISVLSNLPYHLSSQILFQLAELPTPPVQQVLTFQREFAERVRAEPRTPAYGAMSILIQLQFEVESLGVLPAGAFYPAPEVDSEALRLRPRGNVLSTEFRSLIKGAFQQRRKRLANNLKRTVPGRDCDAILEKMGIDSNARPEELSPESFRELGRALQIL